MCAPAALAKMYAASDTQPIFGVPAKPAALRGKEEQGSGRMAYFEAAGIKISRSKADFAIQQKNQTGAQPQRVRFGKEEQRRKRALIFIKIEAGDAAGVNARVKRHEKRQEENVRKMNAFAARAKLDTGVRFSPFFCRFDLFLI